MKEVWKVFLNKNQCFPNTLPHSSLIAMWEECGKNMAGDQALSNFQAYPKTDDHRDHAGYRGEHDIPQGSTQMAILIEAHCFQRKSGKGGESSDKSDQHKEADMILAGMMLEIHGDEACQKAADDIHDKGFIGEGAFGIVIGYNADGIA